MIDWDRHEINVRSKIGEIIAIYQISGELFGVPPELRKEFMIFRPEAMPFITDELYRLVKEEIDAQERRDRPN